ncbi:hypothetical protein HDU67_000624 [Dinochytrium kinnereticum]|nr:hypothetical protein HDU67_000624 [Dinochytrium kinnereticum]
MLEDLHAFLHIQVFEMGGRYEGFLVSHGPEGPDAAFKRLQANYSLIPSRILVMASSNETSPHILHGCLEFLSDVLVSAEALKWLNDSNILLNILEISQASNSIFVLRALCRLLTNLFGDKPNEKLRRELIGMHQPGQSDRILQWIESILNEDYNAALSYFHEAFILKASLDPGSFFDMKPELILNALTGIIPAHYNELIVDELLGICSCTLEKNLLPNLTRFKFRLDNMISKKLRAIISGLVEYNVSVNRRTMRVIAASTFRLIRTLIDSCEKLTLDQYVLAPFTCLVIDIIAVLDILLCTFDSSSVDFTKCVESLKSFLDKDGIPTIAVTKVLLLLASVWTSNDLTSDILANASLSSQLQDILMQRLYSIDSDLRESTLDFFRIVMEKGDEPSINILNCWGFIEGIARRKSDRDAMVRISWIRACKAMVMNRFARSILEEKQLLSELISEILSVKVVDSEATVRKEALGFVIDILSSDLDVSSSIQEELLMNVCDDVDSEVRSQGYGLVFQLLQNRLQKNLAVTVSDFKLAKLLKNSLLAIDTTMILCHVENDDFDDLEVTKSLVQDTGLLANEEVNIMACYDC